MWSSAGASRQYSAGSAASAGVPISAAILGGQVSQCPRADGRMSRGPSTRTPRPGTGAQCSVWYPFAPEELEDDREIAGQRVVGRAEGRQHDVLLHFALSVDLARL